MFKKILVVLALAIAAFAGYVAIQPDTLVVERQATVNAAPSQVFAQVDDLHRWEAWSPWAKIDPNAKVSFEGPASGKGAAFKWSGNEKIGEGTMTIVDSRPNEAVDVRVDFKKPFENTSYSKFEFKPDGERTHVTWRMSGEQNFIAKAICVVFNGKKMMGDEMEKGLAGLGAAAATGATSP